MRLSYGSYQHDENEVFIVTTRPTLRADSGRRIGYKETWTISGRLQGDSQSALTTKINSLRTAYGVDGGNLILLDNSSANSAFVLNSNSTSSGVQIEEITFPDLNGAQYTTYVDYQIRASAEVLTGDNNPYDTYTDTLSITGNGGPVVVLMETLEGIPIPQTVRQRSRVTAVQSGTATKTGSIPPFPPLVFPGNVLNEQINKSVSVAQRMGSNVFSISWTYPYQATSSLTGIPVIP